jgi:hypothetical protein
MTWDKLIQLLYDTSSQESNESVPSSKPKHKAADQLTFMDQKEIMELLHNSNLIPPPVCPCDTPNPSDNKSHWTTDELHQVTGCHHFRNYKHLIYVTRNGQYINSGKFPVSFGA